MMERLKLKVINQKHDQAIQGTYFKIFHINFIKKTVHQKYCVSMASFKNTIYTAVLRPQYYSGVAVITAVNTGTRAVDK